MVIRSRQSQVLNTALGLTISWQSDIYKKLGYATVNVITNVLTFSRIFKEKKKLRRVENINRINSIFHQYIKMTS